MSYGNILGKTDELTKSIGFCDFEDTPVTFAPRPAQPQGCVRSHAALADITITTYYLLLTTYYTYYLLLTTFYLPLTTYYLLLTTYY